MCNCGVEEVEKEAEGSNSGEGSNSCEESGEGAEGHEGGDSQRSYVLHISICTLSCCALACVDRFSLW